MAKATKIAPAKAPRTMMVVPVPEMTTIEPASSAIAQIGYDHERSLLFVRFNSGNLYGYENVQIAVWEEFVRAPSKGRFFGSAIKGKYADSPIQE